MIALCVYGFIASVLPVWLLLVAARLPQLVHEDRHHLPARARRHLGEPRAQDAGVHRVRRAAAGPIIPGPLFPFCFITIACGAISGFHALISSGTTSKMIDKESDIRPIGYGAMLVEGVVGVMALIAATRDAAGRLLRHQRAARGSTRT